VSFCVGIGYDVHRLVTGRQLILGGVEIAYKKGLLGHSDGDVLVHAVIDAIIGALGKGDIGGFFPDTDEAYRGKSGQALLVEMFTRLKPEKFVISNVDTTIIAQEPKLFPHIDRMKANLGRWLSLDPSKVNVKAKTHEGIGALGRQEGIAAIAVVLMERMD